MDIILYKHKSAAKVRKLTWTCCCHLVLQPTQAVPTASPSLVQKGLVENYELHLDVISSFLHSGTMGNFFPYELYLLCFLNLFNKHVLVLK